MMPVKNPYRSSRGQTFSECVLLQVLVAFIVVITLVLIGKLTAGGLTINFSSTSIPTSITNSPTATPAPSSNAQILQDMTARILDYYQLHKSWPRTWSPYNFTDVGLNPADYS